MADLADLRAGDRLAVTPVGAFYLSTDINQSSRSGVLETWAARIDERRLTAFHSLYVQDSERSSPPAPVEQSLLPLDADQRTAVRASRTEPVSVVVGPPGTGKSHTVAAIDADAIDRGQRVLLATRSQHAASVLIDFIDEAGGPPPVVFGDNRSRADLANDLWNRLSSGGHEDDTVDHRLERALDAFRRRRADVEGTLAVEAVLGGRDVVARILRGDADVDLERARRLLATVDDPETGWWRRRRTNRRLDDEFGSDRAELRHRLLVDQAERAGGVEIESVVRDLFDVERYLRRVFGQRLQARLGGGLGRRERAAVMDLTRALRSGRVKRREILADFDTDRMLDVIPLWIGTIGDIEDLLPPDAAMFDLVIIDEASQVDQATAPSALLRAKRLVAVGDANQLRHTSFLADDAMALALDQSAITDRRLRSKLDLRRNSLLDVAAAAGPTVELSTHYRSNPHLIDFAARQFYDGRVQPATRHPGRDGLDCIDVLRVTGVRTDDGNPLEAAAVVDAVHALIGRGFPGTIGIVSPLRAQADAIASLVLTRFTSHQIERHELAVGTVHAFQGAERDHVFISLAVDDASPGGSFAFIENRNLFNVMVTRARQRCTVVTSLTDDRSGLIAQYLRHGEHPSAPPATAGAGGPWTRQVESFLTDQGITVRAGYPVGHHMVDLVVGEGSSAVALDCEVHPDGVDAHHVRAGDRRRSVGGMLREQGRERRCERKGEANDVNAASHLAPRRRDAAIHSLISTRSVSGRVDARLAAARRALPRARPANS